MSTKDAFSYCVLLFVVFFAKNTSGKLNFYFAFKIFKIFPQKIGSEEKNESETYKHFLEYPVDKIRSTELGPTFVLIHHCDCFLFTIIGILCFGCCSIGITLFFIKRKMHKYSS